MKISTKLTAAQIDAVLPQTQCGECGYGGCLPYATAIVIEEANINLCPPGGTKVLKKLAELTHRNINNEMLLEMQAQEKKPMLAKIREQECIGCTKCIQACPVDAIIGAAKQLHVILKQECTGCGLCIDPCPVDCIDMITVDHLDYIPDRARTRFQAKNQRKATGKSLKSITIEPIIEEAKLDKKAEILAAVARARLKKNAYKV